MVAAFPYISAKARTTPRHAMLGIVKTDCELGEQSKPALRIPDCTFFTVAMSFFPQQNSPAFDGRQYGRETA